MSAWTFAIGLVVGGLIGFAAAMVLQAIGGGRTHRPKVAAAPDNKAPTRHFTEDEDWWEAQLDNRVPFDQTIPND